MRNVLPLLLALATVRCATVAHGRYQGVPVTSDPPGAVVRVDCGDEIVDAGFTPLEVQLLRKSEDCAITLAKDGYEPQTIQFDRVRSGLYYANMIPGVVTGMVSGAGLALGAVLLEADESSVISAFAIGFTMGAGVPALIDHAAGGMYKHIPERVEVALPPK